MMLCVVQGIVQLSALLHDLLFKERVHITVAAAPASSALPGAALRPPAD
jgi:hypothetical protein